MSEMINKLSDKLGLKDDEHEQKDDQCKMHGKDHHDHHNHHKHGDMEKDTEMKSNKKDKAGRGYVHDWKTSMD